MKKTVIAISATRRSYVSNFLDFLTAIYGVAPGKGYTKQLVFKLCQYVKSTLRKHEQENDRRTANRLRIISGIWKAIQMDNQTEHENHVVSAVIWAEKNVKLTDRLLRRDAERYSDFYKIMKQFKDSSGSAIRDFNEPISAADAFFEEDTPVSAVDFYNLEREYDRVSRMERSILREPEKRIINQYLLEAQEKFKNRLQNIHILEDRNALFRTFYLRQLELINSWHLQLDPSNRRVNLTGLDFSGMNFTGLDLRGAILNACNFSQARLDNINVEAKQFVFACGLTQSTIDKRFLEEVQVLKNSTLEVHLFGLEKNIGKKWLWFRWLLNFHTLKCKARLPEVGHLKLSDLRVISEIALGSCYLNLLPEEDDLHFTKIIEGKYLFETLCRDDLLQKLERMMSASGMLLSEEAITFMVHQRLVLFFEYLNEKEEIKNIRLILSDLPNEICERIEPRLKSAMASFEELKLEWEMRRPRVEQNVLTASMAVVERTPDPGLCFGAEERIARAIEFAKGQPHLTVDLKNVAIMRFTPELIRQLDGVQVDLTEAQCLLVDHYIANVKVDGEYPLHLAIKAIDVTEVKRYLRMGATIYLNNVNHEEGFESTLELAILSGNRGILELLMKASGEVHRAIDARSIKLACFLGYREIAIMLYDLASADANGRSLQLDEFTYDFLFNSPDSASSPSFNDTTCTMFRSARFHQTPARQHATLSAPVLEPVINLDAGPNTNSDANRKG